MRYLNRKLTYLAMLGISAIAACNLSSGSEPEAELKHWTQEKFEAFDQLPGIEAERFFWVLEHRHLFTHTAIKNAATGEKPYALEFYHAFLSQEDPTSDHARPLPNEIGQQSERFYRLCSTFLEGLQDQSDIDLEFTMSSKIIDDKIAGCFVRAIRPDRTGTIYIMFAEKEDGFWVHRNHTWIIAWD